MLTRIQVSNYRSLGESLDLTLGNLVVLVGRNGAGKSSLVDVPRFVAHALKDGLDAAVTDRGNLRQIGRWSAGRPFDVHIRIDASSQTGEGFFDLVLKSKDGDYEVCREEGSWASEHSSDSYVVERGVWSGPDGLAPRIDRQGLALPLIAADARFKGLHDELRSVAVYSIFPAVLRNPQRFDGSSPMLDHGENWATALRTLLGDPGLKTELLAALDAIVGDIDDARVQPVGGFLSPGFRHGVVQGKSRANPRWFDANQESDGTLRVAGILTALLQRPAPGLLAIEEPELTVHPGAIPVLLDYLREASDRGQVIVTTHSPDLLDRVDPSSIRVAERIDGVTSVGALAEDQIDVVRKHLAGTGELLRIEGLRSA